MNFYLITGGIIAFFGWLSWKLTFGKNGMYNPPEMPSLDNLSPEEPFIPASVPPIMAPSATLDPKTITSTSMPKTASQGQIMLSKFCDAIALMEGANPANNNEGNCRCSPVGYLPMYGNVTCNPHGFAVFPTKALGRLYLENMVHFKAHNHPTWTIYDFFAVYAPSSDQNDPKHYAEFVANRLGVIPQTTLANLFV